MREWGGKSGWIGGGGRGGGKVEQIRSHSLANTLLVELEDSKVTSAVTNG